MDRNDAKIIVNYFENQKIKYDDKFCEWIGMKPETLNFVLNSFKKNFSYKNFFKKRSVLIKKNSLVTKINKKFKLNQSKNFLKEDYIVFGKGHKNLV